MRVTGPLIKVLSALLEAPDHELYGLEVMRRSKLTSGTLYPIFDRLEEAGIIAGRWEDKADSESGGPRRRFYRLTPHGAVEAHQILLEYGINPRITLA